MSRRAVITVLVFALALVAFASMPAFELVAAHPGSASASPTPEERACKPCRRPAEGREVENKPPDVTAVELDKPEVRLPCADAAPTRSETNVRIAVTAVDPDGDVLMYNYTVSGGRIVGTGRNVVWDLTGAQPGTYIILAGVDDGCGVCGRTQRRSVTVVACPAG